MSVLKELRKAAGFRTGRDFALSVGVPPTTYARHEQQPMRIPPEKACLYANALRTSLDLIYEYEDAAVGYEALRRKYAISDEEYKLAEAIRRKYAFWDFDAEMEAYELNRKYEEEKNAGKKLEPTNDEIEEIIDEYLELRMSDYEVHDEMRDMREAIFKVTGIAC